MLTADMTRSRLASVVLYCYRRNSLPLIQQYLREHFAGRPSFGTLMEWMTAQVLTPTDLDVSPSLYPVEAPLPED
jgi:hypothetical protein